MSKQKPNSKAPTYRHHKPTDTARCWVNGAWKSLGRYGSPESHAAFAKLLAELRSAPAVPTDPAGKVRSDLTVDEVALAFWRHAEEHYRRSDGTQTNELVEYRQALKPLRKLYGKSAAAEFGPRALKAVRQVMLDAGWNRATINNRVRRLKRMFKWAASEELIPVAVFQAVATVSGLQKGRSAAPESEPIIPVELEHVFFTLGHLPFPVRGLVLFTLYTGCRPGEACHLRPADIDRTGSVWLFTPDQHKTAHKGKRRVVAIGPKAQTVLAAFEPGDPNAYYFRPRQALEELHTTRTAGRATPLYPSHVAHNAKRKKKSPKKVPSVRYTAHSFGVAVRRAIRRANRVFTEAAVDVGLHVPHWQPNQLRHTRGTLVRQRYGLEAAQVTLGHAHAAITEVYAERDVGLAVKVASEMG